MPQRKLNVLVYSGSGTTSESVRHCLLTLRRLLYPNYAVIPVTEDALVKEPWQATCALLVIPGGADMGYSRVLNGAGNRRIAQYVRAGGRYMGLCAGGYYGSGRCEFEVGNKTLEVIGRRELGLFRGTCRGGAYPGFAYKSEAGARAVQLAVHREAFAAKGAKDSERKATAAELPTTAYSYYNGGGVFVDAKSADNVQVLASYPDDIAVDGGKGRAAIIYCSVGEGAAILTGPHPEFEPINLSERPDLPHYDELLHTLRKDDESQARVKLFKACLVKLGLELGNGSAIQPRLTALHVTTLYPDEVQELMYKWEELMSKKGSDSYIRSENDTFRVLHPDSGPTAWPTEANVAAPVEQDDSINYGYGQSNQKRFSCGMLMDLADRALRYPKLSELIGRVAAGTAPASDAEMFRSILEAIADHEEEGESSSSSSNPAAVAASLYSSSSKGTTEWRESWRKQRSTFDRTIDDIYQAVGRTLLGHPEDAPQLDLEMKQEMWSSLVHSWEGKRRREEEEEEEESNRARNESREMTVRSGLDDDAAGRLLQLVDEVAGDDADDGTIKKLIIYEGGWPSKVAAFDHRTFYQALAHYRDALLSGNNFESPGEDLEWGNQLMYAKVTTSTNTLLEKNPKLLATLPTGFTVTATRQLAARGRGSNVWLAPEGQLILSTVINHPHRFGDSSGNRPVVFVQYLAAIAIVEAIHAYAPGFEALDVKLKWPNDIYARDASSGVGGNNNKNNKNNDNSTKPGYVKIGGILSYCAFQNGHYQVVLGIGLNAVNKRPTTSLEALVSPALREKILGPDAASTKQVINNEKLLASVLVHLEALYKQFCRQGFSGELERRYYRHWLHTNQVVTLEAVAGTPRARVLGISADWGLLQVAEVVQTVGASSLRGGEGEDNAEERLTGRVWKLQSDENSFDYWKGLVRTKS